MGCPLLWISKLQPQVALSPMKSEYIALSHSMRELIAIREVLKKIYKYVLIDHSKVEPEYSNIHKYSQLPQSKVHKDNESCLNVSSLSKMSSRTKHIVVPYHFFRSKFISLEIKGHGMNTENQLADQFTKGLPQDKFERDRLILMRW